MNERFKELMVQAIRECKPDDIDNGAKDKTLQRFAELIVEECIDVVLSSDPSPKMIVHEPYRTIMNNIVEHFGVEE